VCKGKPKNRYANKKKEVEESSLTRRNPYAWKGDEEGKDKEEEEEISRTRRKPSASKDETTSTEKSQVKHRILRLCGNCQKPGHNCVTCPN
jgi:hypothetical protein